MAGADGEGDSLGESFLVHAAELRGFLRRHLQCRETAADVTQQTYLKLLLSPTTEPVQDRRAFLFRVARNLAVDFVRTQRRCASLEAGIKGLYEVTGEEQPDLNVLVIAQEQLEALRAAVADLPPLTRSVFELSRLQELPRQEVADQLGVSESTVAKHLALALRFLREKVGR